MGVAFANRSLLALPAASLDESAVKRILDGGFQRYRENGQRREQRHRLAFVVFHRYCSEPPLTLAQVGALLGRGKERVRQIEARGLRMLRHPSRSHLIPHGTRLGYAVRGEAD